MSKQLNVFQKAAYDTLANGDFPSVCIKGPAGTGKSTVSHAYAEYLQKNVPGWSLLTVAPTGVASTVMPNTTLNGRETNCARTIHSVVKDHQLVETLASTSRANGLTVMVDEAMMVGARQFNELLELSDAYVCRVRAVHGHTPRLQFVLMGDPAQLPAVGFSLLDSPTFSRMVKIHRMQFVDLVVRERFKHCPDLVQLAGLISKRDPRFALCLRQFWVSDQRPPHTPGCDNGILITYRRERCERHNQRAFAVARAAGARTVYFVDIHTGEVEFALAENMRCIMLANKRGEGEETGYEYTNGDMGKFEAATGTDAFTKKLEKLYGQARFLKIDKHLEVDVLLQRGDKRITVKPRGTTIDINGKNRRGFVLPISEGEAITIHKSQGATFGPEVNVTLDLNGIPADSQDGLPLINVACTRYVAGASLRVLPWGSTKVVTNTVTNREETVYFDDVETAIRMCDVSVSKGVQLFDRLAKRHKSSR